MIQKSSLASGESKFYFLTGIFGLVVFGLCYAYFKWMGIPGELNKAAADTSIILMGLSMWLSSLGYFFNVFDWAIVYRKFLGLIGFAFALAHLILSWEPFKALFSAATWQAGHAWPALAGVIALVIFTIMALISNSGAARLLGGKAWRHVLRTGYIAVLLVMVHVVLLKSPRWISWYEGGMKTPPAVSLLVTIFMAVVVLMRLLLWVALLRKQRLMKLA
jgi:DMSO/TMAO reductase YedYZ heme-binding membrane subunit